MLVPGETVARHHTSLGEVIIRYPQLGDAAAMMEYINHMSRERTFITLQGEQKTLEEEEQWLRGILDGMANHQKLFLVAAIENRIVGIAGVSLQGLVEAHVGELGISVAEDFRNQGLGSLLFQLVNQQADQHLPDLRIVMLGVFANNPRAVHVYKKFGFVEYGRLPGGILHRGEYVDHIFMYRSIPRD